MSESPRPRYAVTGGAGAARSTSPRKPSTTLASSSGCVRCGTWPDRNVVASQPCWIAGALPQLVHVVGAALDVVRQVQAPRRVTTDLARRSGVGLLEAGPAGERGDRQPRPLERRPPPRQHREKGRERVPRVRKVGLPGGRVQDELVPEEPSGLVGVPRAAHVMQQGGVEGRPDIVLRQPERPGEAGGQGTRTQRLARLEPEAQVGKP